MSRVLVEVLLDEGGEEFIVAETDLRSDGDDVWLVAGEGRVRRATVSLAAAIAQVAPALRTVRAQLRDAADSPDEVAVEFGLKFGGQTGVVFTKGTAEASLVVKAHWSRGAPAAEEPPP